MTIQMVRLIQLHIDGEERSELDEVKDVLEFCDTIFELVQVIYSIGVDSSR